EPCSEMGIVEIHPAGNHPIQPSKSRAGEPSGVVVRFLARARYGRLIQKAQAGEIRHRIPVQVSSRNRKPGRSVDGERRRPKIAFGSVLRQGPMERAERSLVIGRLHTGGRAVPKHEGEHYFVREKRAISTPPTTPRFGITTPCISSYT